MTSSLPCNPVSAETIRAHAAQYYDTSQLNFGNTSCHSIGITAQQLLIKRGSKPIPFLVESLLQQVGLACLAGSSDTGKSCLLRQLAIAIATGADDFIGFSINATHKRAIYVATEDGEDATSFLLSRQAQQYPQPLDRLTFIFDDEHLFENLDTALTHQPADIVIIDCFQDAYGGDSKDSQKIRSFLHPYQTLAEKHRCLFLFLHHTAKRTENFEPSKNNLLSGQGFEAKMRLVIELRADLSNPHQRHLCVVKGNYLPASVKKESHVLAFNENTFTFTNTGERVPFELLAKPDVGDNGKAKWEEARELKKQGASLKTIAEKMGYNSRTSVLRLFEKAKKSGWDTNTEDVSECVGKTDEELR